MQRVEDKVPVHRAGGGGGDDGVRMEVGMEGGREMKATEALVVADPGWHRGRGWQGRGEEQQVQKAREAVMKASCCQTFSSPWRIELESELTNS